MEILQKRESQYSKETGNNKYKPMEDISLIIPVLIVNDEIYSDSIDICRMLMPSLFPENVNEYIEDFDARFARQDFLAGHGNPKQNIFLFRRSR